MKTLDDLYEEVREMKIDDPDSMHKVLEYMEQLQEESNDYMQLLVKKLEYATTSWEKPWYQEPSSLIVPLKDTGVHENKFIMGTLSSEESKHVEKNWKKFVKKFNVPDKLNCFARWKNRLQGKKNNSPEEHVRQYIAAYLSRGLQRNVRQVYKHVVNHYSRPKKGHYTKDEQKIMDICFHHDPKRAPVILSEVLSREPRGLYNRLKFTVNGKPEKKKISWNISLATKFLKLLMDCTGEDLKGLKNRPIGIDVWRQIEGDFETQAEYLRHFWFTKLHCQMFCTCDVTLRRIRRKVFKILRRSPYQIWTDIKWKDVVAELPDGFTYQFVYTIIVRTFRSNKLHLKLPIEELVKVGLQKTNNKKYGNKRLKTFILNDEGNLEAIKYNNKL